MDTFAFCLLGFFLVGYFVLGGADIGVGMLLPFLGRERRLTIAAIAPFFLGNEVWLVGSAGLLTALFPVLEADLFGRTWGALSVLVPAWILRDMGLWLRGRRTEDTWRTAWDAAIVAGSWGVAASWGVAVGALIGGGGPLFAVTTCGLFALHGAVFATVRLGTETARTVARWVVRAALLAGVPCAIGAGADDLATTVPVAVLLAAVLAGVWVALSRPAASEARGGQAGNGSARDGWALAASALAITAAPVLAALNLPDADLAHEAALTLAVAGPMLPLLIAAQAWVWWTFRGRVEKPSYL
ncbi:cytochrome d ubiquinol oxidase subunit II [Actinoallomurus sp. NPDC050550]|uniref:cytochrome d ubiquinol oxidase subunit II n=1 Tax=Actinoallomurus sp. NPDC050550 TaxID=3154937 RepID=UPI0033EF85F8